MLLEVKGKSNCVFKEKEYIQKQLIPNLLIVFTHARITTGSVRIQCTQTEGRGEEGGGGGAKAKLLREIPT